MIIKQLSAHKNKIIIVSVVYSAILVYLSLKTPSKQIELPSQSDKLFHALAYFMFAVLWFYTFKYVFEIKKKRLYAYTIFFAFLFGVLMELLQGLCTLNREADVKDVFANLFGTVFALLILKYIIHKDR